MKPTDTMKKIFILLAVTMVTLPTLCFTQEESRKSLNDIRFENWTEEDWQDNDYYREVRKYLTAVKQGEIQDGVISMNEKILEGQFIVLEAEPMILGGVWMCISFLEDADKLFRVWVYSFVDEEKEVVWGYKVRSFQLHEEPSGFTKEDYLKLAAHYPEIKLW